MTKPLPTAVPATSASLQAMAAQPFVSLTTFRRSGVAVPTPVWAVWDEGALLVTTPAGSGKVKRLRSQARVELRPCSRTGRVAAGAPALEAAAEVVDNAEAHRRLARVLRGEYGLEHRLVMGLERLRSPRGVHRVVLRVTPP